MKILHISTYKGGGAGTAAWRLHKSLIDHGVESRFLYLDNDVANLTRNNPTIIQKLCNRISGFKSRINNSYKKSDPSPTINTFASNYEIFTNPRTPFDITIHPYYQEADIVHLHWVSNFLDYPSFFKKNLKPIVWTLHDMNPFQGGFHYYEDVIRNQELGLIEQEYRQIKIDSIRDSKIHVVALSNWLFSASSQSKTLKGFPHFLIPNGIDLSVFKPYDKIFARSVFNLPSDKKIVLFVSESLDNKRKGFDLLLEAISKFNDNVGTVMFCAVGNNKMKSKEADIHYIDRIDDERLMALLYSAADVFVLPSREDNLPNVMLESLACGTPIVATPVGGITDVIKSGVNGILAKSVSGEAIFEAINSIILQLDSFHPVEIHNSVMNNFSSDLQVSRYTNLYNQIYSE